jgi:hypothetical protein
MLFAETVTHSTTSLKPGYLWETARVKGEDGETRTPWKSKRRKDSYILQCLRTIHYRDICKHKERVRNMTGIEGPRVSSSTGHTLTQHSQLTAIGRKADHVHRWGPGGSCRSECRALAPGSGLAFSPPAEESS